MDDKEAGTLSDVDIKREIQADLPLIQNVAPEEPLPAGNFQPAAYDLRVGHIITAREYVHHDGKEGRDLQGRRKDSVLLKPGESATLATIETVNLRDKINGLIVPRDRFAKMGLLTLNAGHVDPGWKGLVTAQVINLTYRPFRLHLEDSYFSIIFSYLHIKAENPKTNHKEEKQRLRELRLAAAQAPVSLVQKETLEEAFVSYDDLTFELLKRLWVLVLGLAALAGLGVGIWRAVLALD